MTCIINKPGQTNNGKHYFLTFGCRDQPHVSRVLGHQSADDVDLFQGQLNRVQMLGRTRDVRRPKLSTRTPNQKKKKKNTRSTNHLTRDGTISRYFFLIIKFIFIFKYLTNGNTFFVAKISNIISLLRIKNTFDFIQYFTNLFFKSQHDMTTNVILFLFRLQEIKYF